MRFPYEHVKVLFTPYLKDILIVSTVGAEGKRLQASNDEPTRYTTLDMYIVPDRIRINLPVVFFIEGSCPRFKLLGQSNHSLVILAVSR